MGEHPRSILRAIASTVEADDYESAQRWADELVRRDSVLSALRELRDAARDLWEFAPSALEESQIISSYAARNYAEALDATDEAIEAANKLLEGEGKS